MDLKPFGIRLQPRNALCEVFGKEELARVSDVPARVLHISGAPQMYLHMNVDRPPEYQPGYTVWNSTSPVDPLTCTPRKKRVGFEHFRS
jgi:hypothetical protein